MYIYVLGIYQWTVHYSRQNVIENITESNKGYIYKIQYRKTE